MAWAHSTETTMYSILCIELSSQQIRSGGRLLILSMNIPILLVSNQTTDQLQRAFLIKIESFPNVYHFKTIVSVDNNLIKTLRIIHVIKFSNFKE